MIEFAKTGLGVACVIKEFVKDELSNGQLVQIPLEKPINKREVGFVILRQPSSDSMTKLINYISNV